METKRRPTAIKLILIAIGLFGCLFIPTGCLRQAPALQQIDTRCADFRVLISDKEIVAKTIEAKANTPLRFSGEFRWTDAVPPGTHFIHVAQIDQTTRQTVVSHLMSSGRQTEKLVEFQGEALLELRSDTLLQISADVQAKGTFEGENRVVFRAPLLVTGQVSVTRGQLW